MGVHEILKNPSFNIFFSVILGIGIICMIRKPCTGSECNVNKPPTEEDFDKYVYRMEGGKCYEFKTDIVACPASGAVEAFHPMLAEALERNTGPFTVRTSILAERTNVLQKPYAA